VWVPLWVEQLEYVMVDVKGDFLVALKVDWRAIEEVAL